MYVPKHYQENDRETMVAFMRAHSFGTLITAVGNVPFATHLPFVVDVERGEHGTLVTHMARANPQWHHFENASEILVTFQGPHAYISPRWYASEFNVPTWNYVAVHAYGRVSLIDDPARIYPMLDRLVAQYEGDPPAGWSVPWDDPRYGKLTAGIVAFEVAITRLEGKAKLSQNKSQADRQGAVQHLTAQANAQSTAVAELMTLSMQTEEQTNV